MTEGSTGYPSATAVRYELIHSLVLAVEIPSLLRRSGAPAAT
jgi:hypothetical protein